MGRLKDITRQKLAELKTQYPDKTDAELRILAREATGRQLSQDINVNLNMKFADRAEKKLAEDLLGRYLHDYVIETISDKNTLQEIIYLEIIQLRLQGKLNELYKQDSKALPLNILDSIHSNSDTITKLKNTLGLNRAKEKLNAYDVIEHYKRRYRKWLDENQASRTRKCPCCQKFVLFKLRPEIWETQQHPFFRDNIVYNKHLFNYLGQTVKIDRDFISKVLETSPDYIDWVLTKVKQVDLTQTVERNQNGSEETKEIKKEEVISVQNIEQSNVEEEKETTGSIGQTTDSSNVSTA